MSNSLWLHGLQYQASLSFTISRSLLRLKPIESVMPSNHLILCRPLLPSVSPSVRVFACELALRVRGPKCQSFSFSISSSSEGWFPLGLTGLISLQSKGLSSLLWHHSSKALTKRQFFGVQPSLWSNSHVGTWLLEKHSFDCNLLPFTRYVENGLNFDSEGFPYKQTMNIKELQCERVSTSLNSSQYFKHSYKSGESTQF